MRKVEIGGNTGPLEDTRDNVREIGGNAGPLKDSRDGVREIGGSATAGRLRDSRMEKPENPAPRIEGDPFGVEEKRRNPVMARAIDDLRKRVKALDDLAKQLMEKPNEPRPGDGNMERDVFPKFTFKPWVPPQVESTASSSAYPALFDIYDVDAEEKTFKIRGNATAEVAIAGAWKNLTAGTGFSAISGSDDFEASVLSASSNWVYIKCVRSDEGGSSSIICDADLGSFDDDTEIFPLWYVPVADSEITTSGIIDMRYTKHWVAGA